MVDRLRTTAYGITAAGIGAFVTFLTVVTVFESTWVTCAAGTASCVVTKAGPFGERRYVVDDVVGVMVEEHSGDSGSAYAIRLMTGSGPRGPDLGRRSSDQESTARGAERLSTSIPGTRVGGSGALTDSPPTGPSIVVFFPLLWFLFLTGVAGFLYVGGTALVAMASFAWRVGRLLRRGRRPGGGPWVS